MRKNDILKWKRKLKFIPDQDKTKPRLVSIETCSTNDTQVETGVLWETPTTTAAPLQHLAALNFLRCHPALWSPPTPPSGIITDCQDVYWPRWTQLDPAPGSRKHTLTHIHASCTLRWGGFAPGCAACSASGRLRDRGKKKKHRR